ncbi:NAD(P)(+) transhydrogenase (Re/Si-specific) subunit beta [Sphingobium bisphenolivorans]|uniref:NAD(P)(+) transhydrogenase (Re/Si-specific) subunit beta n=1 Tax=Sphingobium bisphenolivorans TaxID=1335760 RepID=UPI0003B491F8|nr:NAD(P)(+) transhydrogenase (Re/Si-specific) subunit beta [Sphingobium bisphenolivorans]
MDAVSGIGPAVGIGWAFAILLFLLSLCGGGKADIRRRAGLALAGVIAAAGAALYSHDVINLPAICGLLILGAAAGWLIGRVVPPALLPLVLIGLMGLAGSGSVCAALAMWRNPHAFGLLDASGAALTGGAALLLTLQSGFGSMAVVGAVSAGWARRGSGAVSLMLASLVGWSAAASGFLLGNLPLVVAGGLAGSTGLVMALRLCRAVNRKRLADARRGP